MFLILAHCLFLSTPFAHATDNALVLLPKGALFEEILEGIYEDLEGDIKIETLRIGKSTKTKSIDKAIVKYKPKSIVLIGNSAIKKYEGYQNKHADESMRPCIAIAAIYLDLLMPSLKNCTGILYEIPAVTSIANARLVMEKPIKRVAVLYRSLLKENIQSNIQLSQYEGVQLIPFEITSDRTRMPKAIKLAIMRLDQEKIDAIWILNDSVLLSRENMTKAWIPSLLKTSQLVIVNAQNLAATKLNFGNIAISPDHHDLGVQASGILLDIMDNNWRIDNDKLYQPISVKKVINTQLLDKKEIKIRSKNLQEFDLIIE